MHFDYDRLLFEVLSHERQLVAEEEQVKHV